VTETETRAGEGRYRLEQGRPCIDVSLASFEELFDRRDPAPFRQRDLDQGLIEYLTDSAEDLARRPHFKIVFWMVHPTERTEVEHAVRGQFGYLLERLRRHRRTEVRVGHVALFLAVLLLAALLFTSQLVLQVVHGTVGAILREGLVILGWVAMWRPTEILLYDTVPFRRRRRLLSNLLAAPVELRQGVGPGPPPLPPSGAKT
jgi:hypothetical protein